MRMRIPGKRVRQKLIDELFAFFNNEIKQKQLRESLRQLTEYYELPPPKLKFLYRSINNGDTLGVTFDEGVIHLIHPEYWKNSPRYGNLSAKTWVRTVLHEMGHYIFWAECEKKANLYEKRMIEDIEI